MEKFRGLIKRIFNKGKTVKLTTNINNTQEERANFLKELSKDNLKNMCAEDVIIMILEKHGLSQNFTKNPGIKNIISEDLIRELMSSFVIGYITKTSVLSEEQVKAIDKFITNNDESKGLRIEIDNNGDLWYSYPKVIRDSKASELKEGEIQKLFKVTNDGMGSIIESEQKKEVMLGSKNVGYEERSTKSRTCRQFDCNGLEWTRSYGADIESISLSNNSLNENYREEYIISRNPDMVTASYQVRGFIFEETLPKTRYRCYSLCFPEDLSDCPTPSYAKLYSEDLNGKKQVVNLTEGEINEKRNKAMERSHIFRASAKANGFFSNKSEIIK